MHVIRWCDKKTDVYAIGASTRYLVRMIFGRWRVLKPHHPSYLLRQKLLRMADWCTWPERPTAAEVHACLAEMVEGTPGLQGCI